MLRRTRVPVTASPRFLTTTGLRVLLGGTFASNHQLRVEDYHLKESWGLHRTRQLNPDSHGPLIFILFDAPPFFSFVASCDRAFRVFFGFKQSNFASRRQEHGISNIFKERKEAYRPRQLKLWPRARSPGSFWG